MKWFLSAVLCAFTYTAAFAQNNTSLDYYLQAAKINSPLLKDLQNQILSNQVDSLRLKAGYKPQVNLNSAGLYAPIVNGYGYSEAVTNEHTLNALLGVSQSLASKANINSQIEAITLQSLSLGNAEKISEQDLKKAITNQYITAYGDLRLLEFNRKVVDLLTDEEDILKKLTRSNVYRQSDYLTFLVTLKQQELQVSQARAQFKNDYATLNYLAGVADTTTMELDSPAIAITYHPDIDNSIFFRQYHLDSLKLINGREQIDYTYKPKINAVADGGYESDFMGQPYKNFGASVGFNFTLPIYDGGQRKMQYRKLLLQEETRENYKAFYNNQYRQQIAQLNQQLAENAELLAQVNDQSKFVQGLINVDIKLLQTGDVKIADLILAINNYLTVRNLTVQTVVSKLQLINQLNYWNR
jgi:outer membrane protein TolC